MSEFGLTGLIWTPGKHRILPQIECWTGKCTTDQHLPPTPSLPWDRCLWSLADKLPGVLPCQWTSRSCLKQELLELGAVKQFNLMQPQTVSQLLPLGFCCGSPCSIPGNTPFMLPSPFAMLHTQLQQHTMVWVSSQALLTFWSLSAPTSAQHTLVPWTFSGNGWPFSSCMFGLRASAATISIHIKILQDSTRLNSSFETSGTLLLICLKSQAVTGSHLRYIFTNVKHTHVKPPVLSQQKPGL